MNSIIVDVSIVAAVMTLLTAVVSFMNNAVLANRMRKVQADKDIMDMLAAEVKSQKLIIETKGEELEQVKAQYNKLHQKYIEVAKELEVYTKFTNSHIST